MGSAAPEAPLADADEVLASDGLVAEQDPLGFAGVRAVAEQDWPALVQDLSHSLALSPCVLLLLDFLLVLLFLLFPISLLFILLFLLLPTSCLFVLSRPFLFC